MLGAVASHALASVARAWDRVEHVYATDIDAVNGLRDLALEKTSHGRAYLLTGDEYLLEASDRARKEFTARLERQRANAENDTERELIDAVGAAERINQAALSRAWALRRAGGSLADVARLFADEVAPKAETLMVDIASYSLFLDSRIEVARDEARAATARAKTMILLASVSAVFVASVLGLWLVRLLEVVHDGAAERTAVLERAEAAVTKAEEGRTSLAATVERLERVNADLDAFAGRIAHDLRNLLAPIALVPARVRRAHDEEAIERIASSLERAIVHANAVLEGLLAFSRSGRPAEGALRASVRDVVTQVVEELAPIAASTDATVEVAADDAYVACAPELLHVVVLNLLGNALKFIAGSPERRVVVRAVAEDGGVSLFVEDTGPGIPADAIPRIFEPFFRVPGARAAGTGIGLATVMRIVTAHGGRIGCSSTLGHGAAFHVWLPCPNTSESTSS